MPKKEKQNKIEEERKSILQDIIEDVEFSRSYFIELFFATIIVVLGLLTDSTAIVIGAMLISPIFLPILGVSLGIINSKDKVLRVALTLLGISVVSVFIMAFVITRITPIVDTNTEILARANPTILDLFIALASAVIGILAFFDNKIASTSAGVAISISLLPPLATSGIAAAFGDVNIMTRSMLLFLANVGAIVFAGIITLYFLNIRPRRYKKDQQRWKYGVFVSTFFILLISIPLTLYFTSSIRESRITRDITETLNSNVSSIHPEAELEDVTITYQTVDQEDIVDVKATILLPEQVFLTLDKEQELKDEINQKVDDTVKLKFNILNTLLVRDNNSEQGKMNERIEEIIRNRLVSSNDGLNIDSIEVTEQEDEVYVDLLLRTGQGGELPTANDREDLESIISKELEKTTRVSIAFIPVTTIEDQSEESLIRGDIRQQLQTYLPFISKDISTQNVVISSNSTQEGSNTEYEAEILLLAPRDFALTEDNIELLEANFDREIDYEINYTFKLIDYR